MKVRSTKGNKKRQQRGKPFKRFKKKSHYFASNEVVTYMAPRQMPLPPRYRCKFTSAINFALDNTYAWATGGLNHFNIKLNSLYRPFEKMTSSLTSGIVYNVNPAIVDPTGFTQLCAANMYNQFRVYSAKLELQVMPVGTSDAITVALTPTDILSSPVDITQAMAQPWTKYKDFVSGKIVETPTDTLKIYQSSHKFLGCTKRALEDDLSGRAVGVYNADPAVPLYFGVVMQLYSHLTALTNPMYFHWKLTQYAELWNLTSADMPQ